MAEATSEGKSTAAPEGDTKTPKSGTTKAKRTSAETVTSVRKGVASAIWLLAVLAAIILAIGALMVALDFNPHNGIVNFFVRTAHNIDLGSFKTFRPSGKSPGAAHSALVKTVLVSWGIAAVIYLVVGKILDRIIRP